VEADGLGLRSSGLWSDAEAGVSAARGRDRREATHPLVVSSGARRASAGLHHGFAAAM